MRTLIVYESMFGNTAEVAQAVARGLAARGDVEVEVRAVGIAPERVGDDVDLLVVGAPTHAFGLSRPSTRADAAGRGATVEPGPDGGVREWLDRQRPVTGRLHRPLAATFDTRVHRPLLPGSAARAAGRRLRRLGYRVAARPTSFWVRGTAGPLRSGELDRAEEWGAELALRLTPVDA
jgi:hypothetical protein